MEKNKLNVCFLIPLPPPYGGIANWSVLLDDYLGGLEDINYQIINISPRKKSMTDFSFISRIICGVKNYLTIKKELRKILKEKNTNVIHITTSGQLALFRDYKLIKLANRFNVPVVYHIRFGRIPDIAKNNKFEYKLFLKNAKLCAGIISIDKKTFETISFLSNSNRKVCLIPNPFDNKKIKNVSTLSQTNVKKVILYAGWVIKSKGIEDLIISWNNIKDRYDDYCLKICGPYKDNYMKKLKSSFDLQRVIFTGEIDNKSLLLEMNESDIFVFPSHTEGFPNVILEAMALGKPIIATDVGAIPDMLADNCGIVVEKQNILEITKYLELLINDKELKNTMSRNAKGKLNSEYLISGIYEKYHDLWMAVDNENCV